jgi:hypothetical protein
MHKEGLDGSLRKRHKYCSVAVQSAMLLVLQKGNFEGWHKGGVVSTIQVGLPVVVQPGRTSKLTIVSL